MQLIGLWQKTLVKFESLNVASLVASKWSVFMEKNSMCVALAISNKKLWITKNCYQTLLYTLPVGITAHNLSDLLNLYNGKTCFIGCNLSSYVHNRCVIVCFTNKTSKLAAIDSVLIFKGVNLCWAGLSLACCTLCKKFGHVSDVCLVSKNFGRCSKHIITLQNQVYLANIYKKKQAPVVCLVLFEDKTWAQIASSFLFYVALSVLSSSSLLLGVVFFSLGSALLVDSELSNCLAVLKCSLELLLNQVSVFLKKLSFMELVFLTTFFLTSFLVVLASLALILDLDMILNNVLVLSILFLSVGFNVVANFNSSSFKVLTTKISRLESKMVALEASINSVL
ncbi:hypothetical protein G9A89_008579 [Geosiphon pyriformis]|nr:hypothetical protein G9A89_008579 [Geosiphon pyriformis]